MEVVASVLAFMTRDVVKNFLLQYAAEKALDYGKDKAVGAFKNEQVSIQKELFAALNKALQDTCEHFGWEYDENAIFETFIIAYKEAWQSVDSFANEDSLKDIISEAVGKDVDDDVLQYWCYTVNTNIASFTKLQAFLMSRKIEAIYDNTREGADRLRDLELILVNKK